MHDCVIKPLFDFLSEHLRKVIIKKTTLRKDIINGIENIQ